jgi:hypothetical protein
VVEEIATKGLAGSTMSRFEHEDAELAQQAKQLNYWDWNEQFKAKNFYRQKKTTHRGTPSKTTMSSAATAFKPEPFTGKRHGVAKNRCKRNILG